MRTPYVPNSYPPRQHTRQKRIRLIELLLLLWIIIGTILLMVLMFLLGQTFKPGFQNWNLQKDYPVIRIYTKASRYEPIIRTAIQKYNTVIPIFAEVNSPENADITCYDFSESYQSKENATERTGTLGVTQPNGRIGFNSYLLAKSTEKQILSVALHELGHAIGLSHSTEKNSVMNSKYDPVTFTEKDIRHIREIWK